MMKRIEKGQSVISWSFLIPLDSVKKWQIHSPYPLHLPLSLQPSLLSFSSILTLFFFPTTLLFLPSPPFFHHSPHLCFCLPFSSIILFKSALVSWSTWETHTTSPCKGLHLYGRKNSSVADTCSPVSSFTTASHTPITHPSVMMGICCSTAT